MAAFAWITLGAFVAIGVLAMTLMIRSLRRPAEPDIVVYFAAKRHLVFCCVVWIASIAAIIQGLVARQYYLPLAGGLLISYTLPIVAEAFRTREALRRAGRLPLKKSRRERR